MIRRTSLLGVLALLVGGVGIASLRLQQDSGEEPAVVAATVRPTERAPLGELSAQGPLFHSEHEESLQKLPVAMAARFMRAEGEWEGMIQSVDDVWPCMPDGTCSMARACIDGRCLPCMSDSECPKSELCVLNHCVRDSQVECSSRRDCEGADALCLLSGYTTHDGRGNSDMRAYCLQPFGGKEPTPEEVEAELARQNSTLVDAPPPRGPSPEERVHALLRGSSKGP
jgi:hypothetical protein